MSGDEMAKALARRCVDERDRADRAEAENAALRDALRDLIEFCTGVPDWGTAEQRVAAARAALGRGESSEPDDA